MNIQRTCRHHRWIGSAWLKNVRLFSQQPYHALQNRNTHRRPSLKNEKELIERGYEQLLSADGFKQAWIQYQDHLIENLKYHTVGTTMETAPISSIISMIARDPAQAALFNYASMAYNNHFFFRCLATQGRSLPMPGELEGKLSDTFGSIATLRAQMLATASSMFGPGFVWLVHRRDRYTKGGGGFAVMNTYIAGSPLPGAHYRQQSVDLNNQASKLSAIDSAMQPKKPSMPSKESSFMNRAARLSIPPGGIAVTPVLCVNTWEHVWLHDWGIAGKDKFLESWWESIDWDVVSAAIPLRIH